MENSSAFAEAPSTATQPTPQAAPEATPQTPNASQSKPVSLEDKVQAKLKEAREKLNKPETQPAQENKGETKPDETQIETKPTEEVGDGLEVVSYNGKDVPLAELLKDGDFEVFANGEFKKVEGIEKLMDMASIGFAATKRVETAKQAVLKANEVVQEIERNSIQKANEIATNYLNGLLDKVTNGKVNPATGKAFQTEGERKGAVELANRLVAENANSAKSGQPMTRAEIERLVEVKAEEKLKATQADKAQQQRQMEMARITQTAENSLQKVTEPLMQYFTGEDGKTLNNRLFNSFRNEVKAEADKLFLAGDKKFNASAIEGYITKAAKSVLDEWKPSLKQAKSAEAVKAPVTSTNSGMPIGNAGKQKYGSLEDAVTAKIRALRASGR